MSSLNPDKWSDFRSQVKLHLRPIIILISTQSESCRKLQVRRRRCVGWLSLTAYNLCLQPTFTRLDYQRAERKLQWSSLGNNTKRLGSNFTADYDKSDTIDSAWSLGGRDWCVQSSDVTPHEGGYIQRTISFFAIAFVQVNWVVPSNRCGVCAVGFLTERHHLSNADLWRLLFFISLGIMRFFTVKMCLFYSTRQHWFPFCSLQYEISIRPAFEARLSRVIHKIPVNFPSKSLCCCMVMQFIGKVTISHYVLSPVPGRSRRKFRGQQNGFGASQQNSVLLKKQK